MISNVVIESEVNLAFCVRRMTDRARDCGKMPFRVRQPVLVLDYRILVTAKAGVLDAVAERSRFNIVGLVAITANGRAFPLGNSLEAMHILGIGLEYVLVTLRARGRRNWLMNLDGGLGMWIVAVRAQRSVLPAVLAAFLHPCRMDTVFVFGKILLVALPARLTHGEGIRPLTFD